MPMMMNNNRWLVTHIPDDFTTTCPEDFDEDRYLMTALMAVNLAEHKYQLRDLWETVAESFMMETGSDDVTEEEAEYAWRLASYAIDDATALFDCVKPALSLLETPDGFGVDITHVHLDPTSMMFTVEEI